MVEKPSVANMAGGLVRSVSNEVTADAVRSCARLLPGTGVEDANFAALRAHI